MEITNEKDEKHLKSTLEVLIIWSDGEVLTTNKKYIKNKKLKSSISVSNLTELIQEKYFEKKQKQESSQTTYEKEKKRKQNKNEQTSQ